MKESSGGAEGAKLQGHFTRVVLRAMLGAATMSPSEIASRLPFAQQALFRSSCQPGGGDLDMVEGASLLLEVQRILAPERCLPGTGGPVEQGAERLFRRVLAKHERETEESLAEAFGKLLGSLQYAFVGVEIALECEAAEPGHRHGELDVTLALLSPVQANRVLTHLVIAALRAAGDRVERSLDISVRGTAAANVVRATPLPTTQLDPWGIERFLNAPEPDVPRESGGFLALLSERLEQVLEMAERRESGDERLGKGIIVGEPAAPLSAHVSRLQSVANDSSRIAAPATVDHPR